MVATISDSCLTQDGSRNSATDSENSLNFRVPTCEDSCLCVLQYLTSAEQNGLCYDGKDSGDVTGGLIAELIASIKSKQSEILRLLHGNEDAIIRRCKKKGRPQWETFLRKHWPSQPIIPLRKVLTAHENTSTPRTMTEKKAYSKAAKMPQIDLDVLCRERNAFLALVYHRSHHSIATWYEHDAPPLRNMRKGGAFALPRGQELLYTGKCMSLCDNDFGTMKDFDHEGIKQGSCIAGHWADIWLESFDMIMSLAYNAMVDLTAQLDSTSQSTDWQTLVTNDFQDRSQETITMQFLSTRPGNPLRDVADVLDLVKRHAEAKADELYDLQTDIPHLLKELEFYNGLEAIQWGTADEKEDNVSPICTMLFRQMRIVVAWSSVVSVFEELRVAVSKFRADIRRGVVLPTESDMHKDWQKT